MQVNDLKIEKNCDTCERDCPQWAKNIAKSNGCSGYISSVELYKKCDTCKKAYCGDALCFGNNYCDWKPKKGM